MGKFLAGLAILFAVAFTLVLLALVPALWEAVTNGGSWGVVGILVLPAVALFWIGFALDKAAKRAGWNATTWKPID